MAEPFPHDAPVMLPSRTPGDDTLKLSRVSGRPAPAGTLRTHFFIRLSSKEKP